MFPCLYKETITRKILKASHEHKAYKIQDVHAVQHRHQDYLLDHQLEVIMIDHRFSKR